MTRLLEMRLRMGDLLLVALLRLLWELEWVRLVECLWGMNSAIGGESAEVAAATLEQLRRWLVRRRGRLWEVADCWEAVDVVGEMEKEKWEKAVALGVREIRRLGMFGLSESELIR